MRCLTLLSTLIIAAALVWSGPVQADESTTHRITGGTFGVAWIASEGLVYTWSPTNHAAPFRVNHLRRIKWPPSTSTGITGMNWLSSTP